MNAKVNLREYGDAQLPTFKSSVEMLNIFWFERLLAGPHPLDGDKGFKGLLAPKSADAAKLFPNDAAWRLNAASIVEGRALYRKHCVECHRPPVSDPNDIRSGATSTGSPWAASAISMSYTCQWTPSAPIASNPAC